MVDRFAEILAALHLSSGAHPVIGEIQVEQHEDPGLSVEAQEGDQTDPHADGHVVAQGPKQPDGADSGEGDCEKHDQRLWQRPGVQEDEEEDDENRQRDDGHHPLPNAFHRFVLTAPLERVAGGNSQLRRHRAFCLVDETSDVALRGIDIDVDVSGEFAILVTDHGWSLRQTDRGELAERNLGTTHRRHQHSRQLVRLVAQFSRIANVDRVALPALDGGGNVLAADRRHDYTLDVVDGQAVARDFRTIQIKVDEVTSRNAFAIDAARSRNPLNDSFELLTDRLNLVEI